MIIKYCIKSDDNTVLSINTDSDKGRHFLHLISIYGYDENYLKSLIWNCEDVTFKIDEIGIEVLSATKEEE